nr:MAG TPA: hypothetical protein [Caudoviricetes sp.]
MRIWVAGVFVPDSQVNSTRNPFPSQESQLFTADTLSFPR